MEQLLWVCVGGAFGSGARFLVAGWALRALGPGFPYGTLTVNVVGSFLLAALMHLGINTAWLSPTVRVALATGALGGFTTYSTFSYETLELLQHGAWTTAAANVLVTVFGCLVASFLGFAVARWLLGG